jgi:chromosome partitioning protein
MKITETKVFAFANHKGGAGKTTATDGFIYSLSKLGYKVLLIDADAQMNLSYSYNFRRMAKNLYTILADVNEEVTPESQIMSTEYPNIDIIIADTNMASIEMELTVRMQDRDRILHRAVQKIKALHTYDFIVFDTNPSLGLLNYNVLMATDWLIIPVECSAYGIEGIAHIKDFFLRVKKYNPQLEIAGVLRSKVQARTTVTKVVVNELYEEFPGLILDTIIEKDETIAQAQLMKQPVVFYGTGKDGTLKTKPAQQFNEMTLEVLKRVQIG